MSTTPKNNAPSTEEKKNTPKREEKPAETEENKGKTPTIPLPHETPAAVRNRRHIQAERHFGSPSDNMLSPCTSKLFGKKKAVSGPTAILRNKQHSGIPMQNLNDEEDK